MAVIIQLKLFFIVLFVIIFVGVILSTDGLIRDHPIDIAPD